MEPDLWGQDPDLDLTVVVPYFNPGDRVRQTIDELVDTLRTTPATFEVIAVSDGSTDGSEHSLDGLPGDVVRTVRLDHNSGKGEALRVGFTKGRGRFLGFIDADGDLPPEQIAVLAAFATAGAIGTTGIDPDTGGAGVGAGGVAAGAGGAGASSPPPPDVVLGTKRHPDSQVVYPPMRRLYSWLWQQAVFVLFRLQVRDTQTGLKLVRRDVLADVLPRMLEKRFAFDLELLVVARHLGYRQFVGVPVRIRRRFGSTVSVRAALGMLLDLLAIWYRLHIRHWYDEPHREPAPPHR
jgi:glycosyltransferase involved in cell wall biosynthesis